LDRQADRNAGAAGPRSDAGRSAAEPDLRADRRLRQPRRSRQARPNRDGPTEGNDGARPAHESDRRRQEAQRRLAGTGAARGSTRRLASLVARQAVAPPILLVEDKDSLRTMLRLALEAQGHAVVEARDQPEAEAALRASHPAVVLSDLRLTNGDGFGVLRAAKELEPELPVIVMTAFGSIQDAVAAMKEGALDFLAKPVDPDHLLLLVERPLSHRRLANENILLKEELSARRGAPLIVGEDPGLKQVTVGLQRAAATD